jgi:hypothetical protein
MAEKITKSLYGGEVLIDFYPDSHRYKLQGRKDYLISVTTCTGVIDKSRFLIPWAVGLTGTFLRQYFENAKVNQFTSEELLPVIEEALKQHQVKKEEAASIGTLVHDWAEKFGVATVQGLDLPEIPEEADEKVHAGINAFLDWFNSHEIKFVDAERLLFSKRYEYAGLTDAIAIIDGRKTLIDYKTGKGIYNEFYYQIAAYWHAYEEETGEELDCAEIIHFNKETGAFDKKEMTRAEYELNFPIFLSCLNIKQREKELSKLEYAKS